MQYYYVLKINMRFGETVLCYVPLKVNSMEYGRWDLTSPVQLCPITATLLEHRPPPRFSSENPPLQGNRHKRFHTFSENYRLYSSVVKSSKSLTQCGASVAFELILTEAKEEARLSHRSVSRQHNPVSFLRWRLSHCQHILLSLHTYTHI